METTKLDVDALIINSALFRVEPELFRSISYPPIRWWQRAGWRIKSYLSNLWDALRGLSPDDEAWD